MECSAVGNLWARGKMRRAKTFTVAPVGTFVAQVRAQRRVKMKLLLQPFSDIQQLMRPVIVKIGSSPVMA